ncbi:MAG: 1-acyl-sn-glycerol-3-phosphate acyltransferase [Clostridia bacterium]|nr:1-acyl-sn-glycerol-3-phosphate acyltransferase [Clostridia bacterium]
MADKSKKNKKKKWLKLRHRIIRHTLGIFFRACSRIKYGARIRSFKQEKKRQYLVLFNHTTAWDQFFVALSFRQHLYFLASEDIFSKGFLSSALRFLQGPIPIKKQTTDVRAILNCIKVAKEGGSISLAPEGNRTYSGKTEYMNPSIAPLAKKLGLPIALYRIEGGYGVQPRWADKVRRGKMYCYVSKVIEPEEYMSLTDDELVALIRKELFVNEANADNLYYSKKSAEYLERVIYYCPHCGLSSFKTSGDVIECKKCHLQARYLPTKELEGVGFDLPYRFVNDWYEAQNNFINSTDTTVLTEESVWEDKATYLEVIPYQKKKTIAKDCEVKLYGDRITISDGEYTDVLSYDECFAVTVLGKNKVNIYRQDKIYQLKGGKEFNGIKFVHFYNRYKNIKKGDINSNFLGL